MSAAPRQKVVVTLSPRMAALVAEALRKFSDGASPQRTRDQTDVRALMHSFHVVMGGDCDVSATLTGCEVRAEGRMFQRDGGRNNLKKKRAREEQRLDDKLQEIERAVAAGNPDAAVMAVARALGDES